MTFIYPSVVLRHQARSACSTVDWSPVTDFNTFSIYNKSMLTHQFLVYTNNTQDLKKHGL